ncbi:hypothetical protein ACVR05_06785 [Streptococcus caprae]|uniref:Uncharacterized protein n=1 Tax=Streptococcus caprae TaxID=1640501 RepID=A0ABV8CVV6_9STRE
MDWVNCIDWFLRILQIIAFVGVILKVSVQKGYSSNIKVEDVTQKEEKDYFSRFRFIDQYEHLEHGFEKILIYPVETDIKKLVFYNLTYENGKLIKKLIETKRDIKNSTAILLRTTLPEGVPSLKIEWTTSDGEIGEHIFRYNGFNGYHHLTEYKYRLTLKKKILSVFGLN